MSCFNRGSVSIEDSVRLMRTESLLYFLTVARAGSFSVAARELFVSQQGLSKSVRALEAELGMEVFKRGGRVVLLTEAGRELVPLAQECVDAERRLKKHMALYTSRHNSAPLKLMVTPFVASNLFNLINKELSAAGLRDVLMVEKELSAIMMDLLRLAQMDDQVDEVPNYLALLNIPNTMLRRLTSCGSVSFSPVFEARLGVIGSDALLFPKTRSKAPARAHAVRVSEIAQLPIVCYKEEILDRMIEEVFAGSPPENVIMHAPNPQLIGEYVDNGRAITFSDTFTALLDKGKGGLSFAPIEGAEAFTVGFAYPTCIPLDSEAASYLKRFKSFVQSSFHEYLKDHPLTWNQETHA